MWLKKCKNISLFAAFIMVMQVDLNCLIINVLSMFDKFMYVIRNTNKYFIMNVMQKIF